MDELLAKLIELDDHEWNALRDAAEAMRKMRKVQQRTQARRDKTTSKKDVPEVIFDESDI